MRQAMVILACVFAPFALANRANELPGGLASELELDRAEVSSLQLEWAKDLPQTIVIRVSKKDARAVWVAHSKEHLAPKTSTQHLTFEQIAMGAEVTGIAYDSTNSNRELDQESSTSSWRFGIDGHPGPDYRRGHYRPHYRHGNYRHYPHQPYPQRYMKPYGYGYGYRYPNYPAYPAQQYGSNPYYYQDYHVPYANYGYSQPAYYPDPTTYGHSPRYSYRGYSYHYESYYQYEDANYYYDYCRWMH